DVGLLHHLLRKGKNKGYITDGLDDEWNAMCCGIHGIIYLLQQKYPVFSLGVGRYPAWGMVNIRIGGIIPQRPLRKTTVLGATPKYFLNSLLNACTSEKPSRYATADTLRPSSLSSR